MAAESLQYTDPSNPSRCIDTLNKLKERFAQSPPQYYAHWMVGLSAALANAHAKQQEWRLALASLDEILYGSHDDTDKTTSTSSKTYLDALVEWECAKTTSISRKDQQLLMSAMTVEILTRQQRLLLQVGALAEAQVIMEQAEQEANHILMDGGGATNTPAASNSTNLWLDPPRIRAQLAMNRGMLAFAHQDYESSLPFFKKAVDTLREEQPYEYNYSSQLCLQHPFAMESPFDLLSSGWNNVALSSLYLCQMKEAVRMMESLVRENPTHYLTERLAFNLATLYELGADTALASRRKRVLQVVAKRFTLHDIGAECFRVS